MRLSYENIFENIRSTFKEFNEIAFSLYSAVESKLMSLKNKSNTCYQLKYHIISQEFKHSKPQLVLYNFGLNFFLIEVWNVAYAWTLMRQNEAI